MNRISIINKNNSFIITNKLSAAEEINFRELDMISRGMVGRLIAVTTYKKKKINFLECKVQDRITLTSYFKNIINKKAFLDIVLQIVKTIKNCDKNIMQVRNLALDLSYIFIDPRTKELSFIYWPIVNSEVFVNVIEFFSSLAFKAIFDSHEDTGYVSEYIGFFKGSDGFSFNNFEKFIMQLSGIGAESSQSHVPTGPTSRPEINGRKEQNTGGISKSAAYFPPSEVTHEEYYPENKAEYIEPRRKAATQNFSETTVLGEDEDPNGGTTVLDDDDGQPAFPHIIREKTGEKIYLDKPSFRIGKEKQYCDYFVSDNNAISRSHADIVTRNNHYYILDNNSTNKTYVDGRPVPAKKEVEIFSGTKLKLANEEFTFYV